jgi:DnaJ homolog subfamily B member 11
MFDLLKIRVLGITPSSHLMFVASSVSLQTGFSLTLMQLDGANFTITIDDTIECDEVLRVPGKGMPRRSGRGFGDLFITFEVEFPDSLSDDQKKILRDTLGSTAAGGSSHSEL